MCECPNCRGSGYEVELEEVQCSICGGAGLVEEVLEALSLEELFDETV
jgi:DnaJ-class molecular chaperone